MVCMWAYSGYLNSVTNSLKNDMQQDYVLIYFEIIEILQKAILDWLWDLVRGSLFWSRMILVIAPRYLTNAIRSIFLTSPLRVVYG